MRLAALLPRLWLLLLLTLSTSVLAGCLGRGGEVGEPEGAAASALRRAFPEQARKVLEQEERFVTSAGGFALGAGARRGVGVELPRERGGAILFQPGSAGEIRIRESGIEGAGESAEGAVAYRRTGGTSLWAAAPGGAEEWLHLEAGVARAGEAVASWEVEGASARQAGEGVELVDAAGWARMRVTAPVAYAAGGREVKARLAVREGRVELFVEAAGQAVLVDPLWVTTGSMSAARSNHTATLLGNGQVLVAGGDSSSTALASAELYDPVAHSWKSAGTMSDNRFGYTATLLKNGLVLVAGGYDNAIILAGAELFDPTNGTWTPTAPLMTARFDHTAVLLGDGRVLVVGGSDINFDVLASAELYDPLTNQWTQAAPLNAARTGQTETLLGGGGVLVTGGVVVGGTFSASVELYDPVADQWTAGASMSTARVGQTATLVVNNQVLVVGGQTNGSLILTTAELYDPTDGTWAMASPLSIKRVQHTATLLANGKVLVVGGQDGNMNPEASAELYDPVSGLWSAAGSMSTARYAHTATLLANGEVLAVGGTGVAPYLASAELYTSLGAPCTQPSDCASGFCADGVCCDTACNTGACDACSLAAGAAMDGTCALLTGPKCDDGNACTGQDTCQSGICKGGISSVCTLTDCMMTNDCDPVSGQCVSTNEPDDTNCVGGVCKAGVCISGGDSDGDTILDAVDNCPTVYNPLQENQDPDQDALGDVCDDDRDGDGVLNVVDNCPSVFNPLQEHANNSDVGDACDCAAPKKDGDPCDDGDLCTPNDICSGGKCKPGNSVQCPEPGVCQDTLCLPSSGACVVFNTVDGAPCSSGICIAGGCLIEAVSQAGASSSGSGGGAGGSGGMMGTSTSASASTGASVSASSGVGAGGDGGGGEGEIKLRGGACGVGLGATDGAPWIGLGLLLTLRRRRRSI
jgi:Thrombospondin type 3 repeat/Galactose oxidase, central domain/Kelch motif